jgi:alkaline phosphatase
MLVATLATGCSPPAPQVPVNIILFIGDGMGAEQIAAASLYKTGTEDGLYINTLPVVTSMATHSATDAITDSAASATAMATGMKVQNGAVSAMLPGDGHDLTTILEMAKAEGKAVGLVTTTFITHATPAAFGAHVDTRSDYAGIAADYLTGSQPHVLFGGGGYGPEPTDLEAAGYTVVTTADELAAHATAVGDQGAGPGMTAALIGDGHLTYIYDGRPDDYPSLVEMTAAAVDLLSEDPDGYFLMVEAGRIDHAAHDNDLARMVPEVLELDDTVRSIAQDARTMRETLVVVTADHETGGLEVLQANGPGVLPTVSWSTDYHTGVDVPLRAAGVAAQEFAGVDDNTEIFSVMAGLWGL